METINLEFNGIIRASYEHSPQAWRRLKLLLATFDTFDRRGFSPLERETFLTAMERYDV